MDHDSEDVINLHASFSDFLLVNSKQWGGETSTAFALLNFLMGCSPDPMLRRVEPAARTHRFAGGHKNKHMNVVVVVVNGGQITKKEALFAAQHNIPIIVIDGSGRFADEVCSLIVLLLSPYSFTPFYHHILFSFLRIERNLTLAKM